MGPHEEKMNGKNYQYVLFDLDGTLTDSVLGVISGFSYVIKKMGREVPDESELRKFVGPPLIVSFGLMPSWAIWIPCPRLCRKNTPTSS